MTAQTAHEAAQEAKSQVLKMQVGTDYNPRLLVCCLDTLEDFAHEQMQAEIAEG